MTWEILTGDCIESMRAMPDASIDSVVTDPPYGIGFMGHDWDQPSPEHGAVSAGHGGCNVSFGGDPHPAMEAGRYDLSLTANQRFEAWCTVWATEALRVLKPGGHAVVFGSPRTFHRLTCGLEDAGFEIRDTLMWIFGSGFPKSLDVSKAIDKAAGAEREVVGAGAAVCEFIARGERCAGHGDANGRYGETIHAPATVPSTTEAQAWEGWGTALKPGYEPIVLARKPLSGTVAATVLEHGTGALNIDASRIEGRERTEYGLASSQRTRGTTYGAPSAAADFDSSRGRWPANVLLDPEAAALLDEASGSRPSGSRPSGSYGAAGSGVFGSYGERVAAPIEASHGGASRFFYCAKASTAERNAGLDGFPLAERPAWSSGDASPGTFQEGEPSPTKNVHPTVKPIELMRWLVRLVTPPGGRVLDMFTGSGTTGCAVVLEGFDFIGLERDPAYVAIATARIAWWAEHPPEVDLGDGIAGDRKRRKVAEDGQLDIFAASS